VRPLVIIPTYQEAGNISRVLQRVRAAVPDAGVLVVDDGSPDGTADLAEATGAELGQVDVLRRDRGDDVLLVAVGAMGRLALEVAERAGAQGIGVTVVDPGWVKPVPASVVELAGRHKLVVTVEDGIRTGGVGAAVAQTLRDARVDVPLRDFGIPPRFLDHGKRAEVLEEIGLTAQDIARDIVETVSQRDVGLAEQHVSD